MAEAAAAEVMVVVVVAAAATVEVEVMVRAAAGVLAAVAAAQVLLQSAPARRMRPGWCAVILWLADSELADSLGAGGNPTDERLNPADTTSGGSCSGGAAAVAGGGAAGPSAGNCPTDLSS